jgi:hypothetical protein
MAMSRPDPVTTALDAARAFRRNLRGSRGYCQLDAGTRQALEGDLERIESRLSRPKADPYAQVMDVASLQGQLQASARGADGTAGGENTAARPTPAAPPAPPQTASIGERAAAVLEAVNFPAFVASLLRGTFQAIVDASVQQVQEYARLVASLSRSVEEFSSENVSVNQARDFLAEQHAQDLVVVLPPAGRAGTPRLLPRPEKAGTSPEWLASYQLGGEELNEELTEGRLLEAGRLRHGEERLQSLATVVLMGINRVVVNDGDVRAKLQFHAAARDTLRGEMQTQMGGLASRSGSGAQTQMMVSTVKVNAQADSSIKADLMGEVRISFRSETFPLDRFADTAAIQLLNRHARWTPEASPARAAPAAEVAAPATGGKS